MATPFFGFFPRSVDVKGRVIVPPDYRESLGEDGFYIVLGLREQVMLYTEEDYINYYDKHMSEDEDDEEQFFSEFEKASNVMHIKPDKSWRICIPPDFREISELSDDVTFVGKSNHVEIYDSKRFNELKAQSRKKAKARIEEKKKQKSDEAQKI